MFYGARSFNQPLNKWNVSEVEDMTDMFEDAVSFNQPLNNWNVSNVRSMYGMFQSNISFTLDTFHLLSGWLKDLASPNI